MTLQLQSPHNLQPNDLNQANATEAEQLNEFSRVDKIGNHKCQAVLFNAIDRYPDNPKKSKRCRDCGSYLVFDCYENKMTHEEK
ncbi:hypothetical protein, partial [Helicobacter bizzozeronii]|uniref:hypothetical protein n=1 Tax=Helicobacter bizzozeronii TaxID=56877 RepID=UPI0013154741